MLNDLINFTIADLDEFQKLVFAKRNEPEYFLQFGEVTSDSGINSMYLKSYNPLFGRICLSKQDSKVTFLSINGVFNITFKDLTDFYGKSREAYSWYDELYFYFFNEQSQEECSIAVYSENKVVETITTIQLWLRK